MSNNTETTSRTQAEIILGAKLFICPHGTTAGEQIVNEYFCPDTPTSYDEPGVWTALGKIETCKPGTDYQSNDLKGVKEDVYVTTTMKLAIKRNLQFTTYDIAPEAVQMTFGLKESLVNGVEQVLFASGNDTIKCWCCLVLTDAYRAKSNIANMSMYGKLTLQNPLEVKSDPTQAQFQLDIEPNPLSVFVPVEIPNAGTEADAEATE